MYNTIVAAEFQQRVREEPANELCANLLHRLAEKAKENTAITITQELTGEYKEHESSIKNVLTTLGYTITTNESTPEYMIITK